MRSIWGAWALGAVVACGGASVDGGAAGDGDAAGGAIGDALVLDAATSGDGAEGGDAAAAEDVAGGRADALDTAGGVDAAGRAIDGGADAATPTSAPGCDAVDALHVGQCGAGWASLRPAVLLDGAWRGAGRDGACADDDGTIRCPAGAGAVSARWESGALVARFEATSAATVEALALEGAADVPGATAWLSNGFQSWSQSGVIALGESPSDAAVAEALAKRGTEETLRRGSELSWWLTWVAGGDGALVAGALRADRFAAWAQVHRDGQGALRVRLVCGGTGERVLAKAGDVVAGEPWWVSTGDSLEAQLATWRANVPSRRSAVSRPAEAGWNSWYDLWDDVDEQAVRENATLARALLDPLLPPTAPPLRIVVDDGWQVRWGEWTPNAKFPSGIDGLAADLAADGFTMGIWLAPLLVDADSALVTAHPDWFVDGATFMHPEHGAMRILDPTHPEAAAHIQGFISTLVGWGVGLLKIDFLFAGTWAGGRHEDVTGMEAYARALALIREAAGEDTVILAVGAPPTGSLPYVDAWRLGGDIAFEPFGPKWPFVANEARSVAARWPFCQVTLCDADPPLLRVLSQDEVGAGAWVAAFAGGALFLSDDLRTLPADRPAWGLDAPRVEAALTGAPAVPLDPVPAAPPPDLVDQVTDVLLFQDTHAVPTVWRLPGGLGGASRVAFNASATQLTIDGATVPPHAAVTLP